MALLSSHMGSIWAGREVATSDNVGLLWFQRSWLFEKCCSEQVAFRCGSSVLVVKGRETGCPKIPSERNPDETRVKGQMNC